jgi:hypothetical protein
MMRSAILVVLRSFLVAISCAAASPNSLDRAPLNTDTDIVGLPWYGPGKAYRYLAFILNLGALAGLVYWLGGEAADWPCFMYVYFGILAGSIILTLLVNPVLHALSVGTVIAFVAFVVGLLLAPASPGDPCDSAVPALPDRFSARVPSRCREVRLKPHANLLSAQIGL